MANAVADCDLRVALEGDGYVRHEKEVGRGAPPGIHRRPRDLELDLTDDHADV